MLEQTDTRLEALLHALEEQRAMLTAIQERQDALHELVETTADRLKRLDQEYTVVRTSLRRIEERFDRRLRERITSMDKRVTTLESSRR